MFFFVGGGEGEPNVCDSAWCIYAFLFFLMLIEASGSESLDKSP